MSTTTASKNISTDSFGFPSPKSSSLQTTCNICKRLLYSFEEILVCRICHDSYHWRCVKPETISHYGENARFICDKCNDTATSNTSSPHRVTNGGIKIKLPNSSETDYRNFASIPSKLSTTPTKDTTVVNAIRYFEEKQQQQQQQTSSIHKLSKSNEFDDGRISSPTNGQYTDDTKTNRRIALESDDENTTSGMFQANYQYTPLKEYAAMKTDSTANDYKNSNSSPQSDHRLSSGHNGGIRYTNKSPLNNSTQFTSPTIDNLSLHNRQQHFTSSTNLNVNENNYRNSLNRSTPYLSHIRDDDNSQLFKTPYQHIDRHSNVESDSGIVMVNSNHQQQQLIDENQIIEKKLTTLVQQLGRQLETDAQKLSEKLELKLKNLEYMIHQQTYIIRRQDEVIERLKTKILKIENERDFFRDRLSIHEQREQDEKKYLLTTETDEFTNRKIYEQDDQQQTLNDVSRKFSTTSSNLSERSRPSSKKTPAPRADQHGSLINNENESALTKFVKTVPTNQERLVSDSSAPSVYNKLISSVPIGEKPAASSRLDNIIHQSNTNNVPETTTSYYNLSETRPGQQQIHDDELKKNSDLRPKRSVSSSSTDSSSTSRSVPTEKPNLPSTTNTALPPRNNNLYRSLESIPRKTSQTESTLKPTNKTASLEFGKRPVAYDDPGSIYITPQEATHPASQYQNSVKGWLRKQNRDSFFKRIERYYCVLSKDTLLMHKHDYDTRPQKVINLKKAKVLYYEDQKHGPSLELTWSNRYNDPKHYHLYAPNTQEAHQWVTGIQAAIQNPDNKNTWQRYRMQT